MSFRSRLNHWRLAAALAYTALIFVGGSVPMGNGGPPGSDKLLHAAGFFLMFGLYFRALYPGVERYLRRAVVWSLASTSLAGGLLEAWQAFLPHRNADFADWVADAVGALLGATVVLTLERVTRRSGPG